MNTVEQGQGAPRPFFDSIKVGRTAHASDRCDSAGQPVSIYGVDCLLTRTEDGYVVSAGGVRIAEARARFHAVAIAAEVIRGRQ